MIVESLIGGLIIGFFVSYFLVRFFDKIPTQDPILKSVILSFIVLIIVTILVEGPASLFTRTSDALRYFLIGLVFNVLRILALGIVVGHFYGKLKGGRDSESDCMHKIRTAGGSSAQRGSKTCSQG
jgi:hypothetical protein